MALQSFFVVGFAHMTRFRSEVSSSCSLWGSNGEGFQSLRAIVAKLRISQNVKLMYGSSWEEDQIMMTGFINRDSPQQELAFGTAPDFINASSMLAASGDASIRRLDDYIVVVADAANSIAARPGGATFGMNANTLALDHKLQFILRAQTLCMPNGLPRFQSSWLTLSRMCMCGISGKHFSFPFLSRGVQRSCGSQRWPTGAHRGSTRIATPFGPWTSPVAQRGARVRVSKLANTFGLVWIGIPNQL